MDDRVARAIAEALNSLYDIKEMDERISIEELVFVIQDTAAKVGE